MKTAIQTVASINHFADLYLKNVGGFAAFRVSNEIKLVAMEMARSNVYGGKERKKSSFPLRVIEDLHKPIFKDGRPSSGTTPSQSARMTILEISSLGVRIGLPDSF